MRAAIYCRVSSDDQVKGYSLITQEQECSARAKDIGATEIDAYIERGVSGDALDRPALNEMRSALRSGAIDLVVMYDPDRMARKLAIQLLLTDEILKHGAKLEFVRFDWQDTSDGRLFYALRGAIAEYEREKIIERTSRGRKAKLAQGGVVNGPKTYGYVFHPETDNMRIDPETAPVVRQMFGWARDGITIRAICGRLAEMHIQPPKNGTKWWPGSVSRILRNESYTGKLNTNRWHSTMVEGRRTHKQRPRDQWYAARIPVIIPEAVWQAVQESLDHNARYSRGRRTHECLMQGHLRCAECGSSMTIRSKSMPNREYLYYRCINARTKRSYSIKDGAIVHSCRHIRSVRTEVLDKAVWDRIEEFLSDPHRVVPNEDAIDADITRQLGLVVSQKKAAKAAQERTLRAYQRALLDEDTFGRETSRLRAEYAELEHRERILGEHKQREIAIARRRDDVQRALIAARNIPALGDLIDFATKRKIVRLLVDRVVVGHSPQGVAEVEIVGYIW